jgi:hypothetical protein
VVCELPLLTASQAQRAASGVFRVSLFPNIAVGGIRGG